MHFIVNVTYLFIVNLSTHYLILKFAVHKAIPRGYKCQENPLEYFSTDLKWIKLSISLHSQRKFCHLGVTYLFQYNYFHLPFLLKWLSNHKYYKHLRFKSFSSRAHKRLHPLFCILWLHPLLSFLVTIYSFILLDQFHFRGICICSRHPISVVRDDLCYWHSFYCRTVKFSANFWTFFSTEYIGLF